MSAAAVLGVTSSTTADPTSKSLSKRSSSNASLDDAASCLWENEPMSAAASLSPIVRGSSLPRVPESEDAHPVVSEPIVPRLPTLNTTAKHAQSAWRPRRPAPSPPQKASSLPSQGQDGDFLEYDITSGLTLQETPRSLGSHRDREQHADTHEPNQRAPVLSSPSESDLPQLARHLQASPESAHTALTPAEALAGTTVFDNPVALERPKSPQVEPAAPAAPLLQLHTGKMPTNGTSDDSIINRFIEDALELSRHGSAATLFESAYSGSTGVAEPVNELPPP